jgi:hypothetical protein
MGFTLQKVNTEEIITFSTKDLLNLLGDPVNDEIQLLGNTYRISSYFDDTGGYLPPAVVFGVLEFVVDVNTNNLFNIGNIDPMSDATLLTVNGITYRYGANKDYHL